MTRHRPFSPGGARFGRTVALGFVAFLAALGGAIAQPAPAPAKPGPPFLWRIDGGKKPSWIFGTIHLQRPDVARPPAAVRKALDGADAVYTEIPMDSTTLLNLLPRLQLPEGKTLESILGKDLSAELERELKTIHPSLELGALSKMRPWVAMATLLEMEDQMKYPGSLPLDLNLFQRAAMAGKEVGGIETPEEQLAVFEELTAAEEADMIRATIKQVRAIRAGGQSPSEMLTQLYLAGDLDALVAKLNELDAAADNPALTEKLMERLLYRCNAVMTERIVKMLRDHPDKSFFFAVGAAHLPGDRGILADLEKAGFKPTRNP